MLHFFTRAPFLYNSMASDNQSPNEVPSVWTYPYVRGGHVRGPGGSGFRDVKTEAFFQYFILGRGEERGLELGGVALLHEYDILRMMGTILPQM